VFTVQLSVGRAILGEVEDFFGIVRDFSASKAGVAGRAALREQLAIKNAELERFTYTVSHDLKSPLITIKGFAGLLEQDARAGNVERLLSGAKRIASAADKMKQLLDELLALSRVGKVVAPPQAVDLTALACEVRDLLSGPLDEASVHVEVDLVMPWVSGDRLRLREVIQNLVENAAKFMGDQATPRVSIGAKQTRNIVVAWVKDNGIGIEGAHLERVFGLFEQLDQKRPGTGVGLALVRRIVDVHGGRAWVESEGLGRGCTFFFELPASSD
jgi:signal transduction histidine kinase